MKSSELSLVLSTRKSWSEYKWRIIALYRAIYNKKISNDDYTTQILLKNLDVVNVIFTVLLEFALKKEHSEF